MGADGDSEPRVEHLQGGEGPRAKLRAAGNALGSEEFEAETDAGKMKRAAAADIVAEKIV